MANLQEQEQHKREGSMTETLKQQQQLEKLLLSEDLEELNDLTGHFNIFNALKLQNNEIRHSNFLAWLMTPYETHKLGSYFLKEFLKEAIKDYSLDENIALSLKDIVFCNFDDTEVKREYKNIDLLLINHTNNFVCIIENKIWTGEHDCQLERYADIVDNEFKDYSKLYIYLAPYNDCDTELLERNNQERKVYYIPMNYEQVHNVINKILRFKADSISSDVRTFIEHYNNMIERNIMGQTDKQIVDLCRKIYRENKAAIDLINENNDFKAELFETLLEILNKRNEVEVSSTEDFCIKCLPTNINNLDKLKFAKYPANDCIVHINFIGNFRWKNCLYVEIGITGEYNNDTEENRQTRDQLLQFLQDKLGFKKFNGKDNWKYTPYVPVFNAEDFYRCVDTEDLKQCLENKINDVKSIYIDGLRDALNEFCK